MKYRFVEIEISVPVAADPSSTSSMSSTAIESITEQETFNQTVQISFHSLVKEELNMFLREC